MENAGYKRAKWYEILRYSFGGLGSNVPFMLVLMYLTFYYTDVVHINAAVVGALFLVSKAVDATASVIVGMLSDRTKSKLGKFRPWIIYGAPILGIFIVLLFTVPSSIGTTAKIAYIFVVFIIYSFVSSAVNIPYHSLTPVMSDDPNQRTTVAMAKQTMTIPAGLLVTAGALPLVKLFGNGSSGWIKLSMLYGVIVVVSFWLCASGAKRYDIQQSATTKGSASKSKPTAGKQFQLISKNFPLLMLLIAFGFDNIAAALSSASNMYFFTYNLHKQSLVAIFGLLSTLATVPTSLLVPILAKKFGKKNLMLVGYILATIPLLGLYFIPYSNAAGIVIMFILSAAIFQITSITGWAALADCVEYGEWKTGLRGEGVVTSALTFINKFGNALGGMLTGFVLAAVGYVAGRNQTDLVLNAIKHMRVTAPVIAYIISIIAMAFYPITNEFFIKITNELKDRKSNEVITGKNTTTEDNSI